MAENHLQEWIGLNGGHLVEKSVQLINLHNNPFSLAQMQLMDTYMSRINARDQETREVVFTKREFEQILGIKGMRGSQLKKATLGLLSQVVQIRGDREDEYTQYTLFEEASARFDRELGQYVVVIKCTDSARKYFFNLENVQYYSYRLKNTISLSSKYAFLLFEYLMKNRFRKSWTESFDYFREEILQCDSEYYKKYGLFNHDILKRIVQEVSEKTDISVTTERVMKGRLVTGIKFTITRDLVDQKIGIKDMITVSADEKAIPSLEKQSGSMDLSASEETTIAWLDSMTERWLLSAGMAATNNEFSEDQVLSLLKYTEDLHNAGRGFFVGDQTELADQIELEESLQEFTAMISSLYREMCERDKITPIQYRYRYLKKMVQAEVNKALKGDSTYLTPTR